MPDDCLYFQARPPNGRVARSPELIYNNTIAAKAETMGFDGFGAEGVERNRNGRSPDFLDRAPTTARIKTLLRDIALSDDLGFRCSGPNWDGHPQAAEKLAGCEGGVANRFIDYETIGEHHGDETGIYHFWQAMPAALIEAGLQWVTPTEAVELHRASRGYDCDAITSWADTERDLSAWIGNVMLMNVLAGLQIRLRRVQERKARS